MNNETCRTRPMPAVQHQAPGDQFIQKQRKSPSVKLPLKSNAGQDKHGHHPSTVVRLSLSHAIQVKSAEYWLRLGEADEAVRELESLPQTAWNHPSAVKARVAALEVLAQRREAIVQEVQAE